MGEPDLDARVVEEGAERLTLVDERHDARALRPIVYHAAIPPDRLVPTHSLDYDRLFRAEGAASAIKPSCVFVDDGLAGHPDFDARGRTGADPAK